MCRAGLGALVFAGLACGACAELQTVCPSGATVRRRVYSGGAESEWCRRGDGVRQGPEVRFYESGAHMVEGEYADGTQEGVWRFYFNQGSLWREDRWIDGVLVGTKVDPRAGRLTFAEADALGRTSSGIIKLVSADPLLGRTARAARGPEVVARYPSGRPSAAGHYDGDGLRTGVWRFWHQDGRLGREVGYDAGVRSGVFREWHPTGAAKTDGAYVAGERDGRWRRWDATGHLTTDEEVQRAMVPP